MTESEARLVLGVNASADSEDILEAYEEAVFEQASFFMRRAFIPKLAKARILKLEKIELSAMALGLDPDQNVAVVLDHDFSAAENHQEVLETYNRAETKIKLTLANTSSVTEAIGAFRTWMELFEAYARAFLSFCEKRGDQISVRLTEAPIFVDYKNSSDGDKVDLIKNECARLKKLIN